MTFLWNLGMSFSTRCFLYCLVQYTSLLHVLQNGTVIIYFFLILFCRGGVGVKGCALLVFFMTEGNGPSWCFSCNATCNVCMQPLREVHLNWGYQMTEKAQMHGNAKHFWLEILTSDNIVWGLILWFKKPQNLSWEYRHVLHSC